MQIQLVPWDCTSILTIDEPLKGHFVIVHLVKTSSINQLILDFPKIVRRILTDDMLTRKEYTTH